MKKIYIAFATTALILSGCSITSSVMNGPNGTYIVSTTGGGFSTQSGLLEELYGVANDHCAKMGMVPEILQQGGNEGAMSFSPGSGYAAGSGFGAGFASTMGSISSVSYPTARILFRCRN